MARWIAAAVAALAAIVPLGAAIGAMARDSRSIRFESLAISPGLLLSSVAWATAIALLATMFAWPAAWLVRAKGWRIMPLLAAPVILPSYLVYSALNLLRAPGTPLGDWLELLAQSGMKEAPLIAGRALALAGLAVWAWPVATLVLSWGVCSIDGRLLDAARIDFGVHRGFLLKLRLLRGSLLASFGLVSLLMLGSAVPLHLAQTPTYTMKVWQEMALSPGKPGLWISCWPLLALGVFGGIAVTKRLGARGSFTSEQRQVPVSRYGVAATAATWTFGTVVPIAALVFASEQPTQVALLLRLHAPAFLQSALVASIVGACSMVLAVAFARASTHNSSNNKVLHLSLSMLAVAALTPGIVIGAGWLFAARATGLDDFGESKWILAAAHLSRFGFVPALVGLWMAQSPPQEELDQRRIEGLTGWYGWLTLDLPRQIGPLAAVFFLCAALSLHEIEASIMVQPVGSLSLAQTVLGFLHFNRLNDLSIVGGALAIGALALALGGGFLCGIGRVRGQPTRAR